MRNGAGKRKWSLKTRLILAFLLTSIIPVVIVNIFSYYNTSGIVTDHVKELTHENLMRTKSSLDVWMESYEDILFQIYTDDDIVAMLDSINSNEDVAVTINQLRRTLHGLFYTKEYIKCITILTENGTQVSYDMITGSSTNSWLDSFDRTEEELYETVSADNVTHIFSTQDAIERGGESYYLFHLGHRIIDYRDIPKRLGAVIVSIDENMLGNICRSEEDIGYSYNFIVDARGKMVSHHDRSLIAEKVIDWEASEEKRREQYGKYINNLENSGKNRSFVSCVYDEKFGWDIVNVSSQNKVLERLENQQKIQVTVLLVSLAVLIVAIIVLIRTLTGELQKLARVMKTAGKGDLSARMEIQKNAPSEVEVISLEFNKMLTRLSESMKKEKEAGERQRDAEIATLEAQINPHFLYNTLDTINWMAIDREEYEISSSINALATILRYGINDSNKIVTVREEQEWLKKYLFLQQTRLKNGFSCEIHVEPEALECRIHKLLLQPFVENAVLHGFEGIHRQHFLSVSIKKEDGIAIEIFDNGKGIPKEMTEQINRGIFPKSEGRNHIGMKNAIGRIKMYYGEKGSVTVESSQGEYTRVSIKIPL